jgi:hypothetical protein
MTNAPVRFLYTNIGRGHPFYLDGIADALADREPARLSVERTDVMAASGLLARRGWQVIRYLYRYGSSPGPAASLYRRLRRDTDYNRGGLAQGILARSLRARFAQDSAPLLVAHAILVAMLAGKPNLLYQHGELVTPGEAVARGADRVFVPTESAARPFLDGGYHREQVIVTGLCIEPALEHQAARSFEARLARLASGTMPVGAFFSSGAEPREHTRRLALAAASVTRAGGRAIVFARAGGRLHREVKAQAQSEDVPWTVVSAAEPESPEPFPLTVALYDSRREETALTSNLFAQFDYFAGPSHERTNWALGLGLPVFVVGPPIGPFSPLNRELLLKSGVAHPLDSDAAAAILGSLLHRLVATRELIAMARSGWEKHDTNGFAVIADFLERRYGTIP